MERTHTISHISRSETAIIIPFWQWETIRVVWITSKKCEIDLAIEKLFDNQEELHDKIEDYYTRIMLDVEMASCRG
jgi:hypothetical protein